MAHLSHNEKDLSGIFPAFAQMIEFFDLMLAAEEDRASFPKGLAPAASALAGASGNYMAVNSAFYRNNASSKGNDSHGLTESMLANAAERDGRFLVVPNVL